MCIPWLWEPPAGAYVVTGADCRLPCSGGVGQAARVGAKCGCTGSCGVPGCQCALLCPQSLSMGAHMTVEFGDRSRVGVYKYTAEGVGLSLCESRQPSYTRAAAEAGQDDGADCKLWQGGTERCGEGDSGTWSV